VTYWAQIFDNSPDRQSAQSAKFKARFPSIEEIYREIERQEKLSTQDLEKTLRESRDLQKDFEQKRRELLKEDKLEWEDKKQLENMLDAQQQLTEQVENVAQDFQQLIDQMQRNDAVSTETLQKMQKIQELMEEISTDELREAMSKFEQALLNVKPEDLRKALENMKFSMEDFSKKIDQTLALLESIKKEQALDKALQISKEMEQMPSALQEKPGDPKQNAARLAQEQENISEKFDNLQQALEEADKLLDPSKDKQLKQEMSDLKQDMKSGQLQKNMQQSQQQLQQNQRAQASQAQSQALEKMRQYTRRLGEMKNSMGGGSMQEVTSAMQKAIRELLIFSKQHEELRGRYANDPYPIVSDLIAQYEGVQVSLNRLFSVPQVTMFLPPKFYIDLTDANRGYRDVFVNVNEMQYAQIPAQLENIQKGLNLMIYDLMQALNNPSMGSGGGGGMQSLMQMLGQMGQEQMALNMLSEQLMMQLQQQGGRVNAGMQQQMQKLASDQERLAENLKRALQNNPEAQKQGNAIKQIIEEAEAISRQLRNNQLSQDLLNRQENIVSRLLDAQRSINKRDQSERRQAQSADPATRGADVNTDYDTLRRKAMLEDSYRLFPASYQQVILKYLKLLNE
jgi:DNA repair exonuclease SbcCD ATPase subunit